MFPFALATALMAIVVGFIFQVDSPVSPYESAQFDRAPREARGEAMGHNMAQFGIGMVSIIQSLDRDDPALMAALMAAAGADPWLIDVTPGLLNRDDDIVTSPGLASWTTPAGATLTPDDFLPRSYVALGPWRMAVYPDLATGQPAAAILFAVPAAPALAQIPLISVAYGLQASKQLSAAAGINRNGTLVTSGYVMDAPLNTVIDNIPADVPNGAPVWIQCFSGVLVVCQ